VIGNVAVCSQRPRGGLPAPQERRSGDADTLESQRSSRQRALEELRQHRREVLVLLLSLQDEHLPIVGCVSLPL
jgi:hypothetical protein